MQNVKEQLKTKKKKKTLGKVREFIAQLASDLTLKLGIQITHPNSLL